MSDGVGTQIPQDKLGSLIEEREWIRCGIKDRVKLLADRHLQMHGKLPNVLFVPSRFGGWLNKRNVYLQLVSFRGSHGGNLEVIASAGSEDILAVGYREMDYTQPGEKLPLADLTDVQGLRTLVAEQDELSASRYVLSIDDIGGEASD